MRTLMLTLAMLLACLPWATGEGAPGRRANAPGKAYGAYLRDPDGNKIAAFCQLAE